MAKNKKKFQKVDIIALLDGGSAEGLEFVEEGQWVDKGKYQNALSEELGHASTETTGVYLHIVDAVTQNPAEFL